MKKKLISILTAVTMLTLCACGGTGGKPQNSSQSLVSDSGNTGTDDTDTDAEGGGTDTQNSQTDADGEKNSGQPERRTIKDPDGTEITLPQQTESIVVLAPSLTQIVTALGMGDKITGCDTYSEGLEGLPEDIPVFDTSNPDMEQLAALAPDMLLTSNLTLYDQESPYQTLTDAGCCVICVPNSDSIADIRSDIEFLASALDASKAGGTLLEDFDSQLKELTDTAKKIPQEERKRVYFEIAPAPDMYSFGNNVYLNEMIELIGAENILADQEGWITVEGETVAAANPDVIFTNVTYTDDPVQEILDRDGWAGISAIKNKSVYTVDNNASSQPNHNIIKAMRQMAEILYPDYYQSR